MVLPAAAPGILTGMILAMARAAGEVAPLMIVGVVKLAPTLPIDGHFPFLHLERKFMHLGFHIYDVGFQSPNVEAAKPLVFATALLLIVLVVLMNLLAIVLRNHLRRKYAGSLRLGGAMIQTAAPPRRSTPPPDVPPPPRDRRPSAADREPRATRRSTRASRARSSRSTTCRSGTARSRRSTTSRSTSREKQITAFIGPSGCGKSTLLRCINRLNDLIDGVRIEGDLRFEGESVYDPRIDVNLLRKRIGMVFQKSNPFPKSIYENVAYGPRIQGVEDEARCSTTSWSAVAARRGALGRGQGPPATTRRSTSRAASSSACASPGRSPSSPR